MIRALFLDRDGVVNHDLGYVHRIDQVCFVDGIFELCRAAATRAMPIVVVTNQAGIGRGYYTEADFARLTAWMRERFAAEGAPLAAVYHCPDHPEHGLGAHRRDSFDRKPNPGMLLRARDTLGLALAASVMVGDSLGDMVAARRAGLPVRCLFVPERPDPGSPPVADPGADPPHTHRIARLTEAIPLLDAEPLPCA